MTSPTMTKIAINNVRVFNGTATLSPPSTIVIVGSRIGSPSDIDDTATHIDATGAVLLPGLIESHAHPSTPEHLESLTSYGVTTTFTMANFTPTMATELQTYSQANHTTDVRRSTVPAAKPDSTHGKLVLGVTKQPDLLVSGAEDAPAWVERQVKEWQPEYVKIVADNGGLDQDALDTLVRESHRHGKKVVCHAATFQSQRQAIAAGADQIHHMPSDTAVDVSLAESLASRNIQAAASKGIDTPLVAVVPTLSIMKAMSHVFPNRSFPAAQQSVKAYSDAGVPVLVGTDANLQLTAVAFGRSIHEEMEMLVECGLSTVDVLRGATSLAAQTWDLGDRGVVEEGRRADLVLIGGDPVEDIKATREIKRVWVGGVEYTKPLGTFEDVQQPA